MPIHQGLTQEKLQQRPWPERVLFICSEIDRAEKARWDGHSPTPHLSAARELVELTLQTDDLPDRLKADLQAFHQLIAQGELNDSILQWWRLDSLFHILAGELMTTMQSYFLLQELFLGESNWRHWEHFSPLRRLFVVELGSAVAARLSRLLDKRDEKYPTGISLPWLLYHARIYYSQSGANPSARQVLTHLESHQRCIEQGREELESWRNRRLAHRDIRLPMRDPRFQTFKEGIDLVREVLEEFYVAFADKAYLFDSCINWVRGPIEGLKKHLQCYQPPWVEPASAADGQN